MEAGVVEPAVAPWMVEILDHEGRVAERHRVDRGAIELGRSYTCDVVLDDRFACPVHARLTVDSEGLRLESLSEVNGVVDASGQRIESVTLGAGQPSREDVFRLGATSVRLRPLDYEMPVARVYDKRLVQPQVARRRGAFAAVAAMLGLSLWEMWTGSWRHLDAGTTTMSLLSLLFVTAGWAGFWAFLSRVFRGRTYFLDHLRIINTAIVAAIVLWMLFDLATFWLAADETSDAIVAAIAVVVAFALNAHLMRVSTRRLRWVGWSVAAGIVAIEILTTWAARDEFRFGTSHFDELAPVPAAWLPTETVDDWLDDAERLRATVDEAVEEALEKDAAERAERAE